MIDKEYETRLTQIHQQIQKIADDEARSAIIQGSLSDGHLWPTKLKLLSEYERILDAITRRNAKDS